MGDSHAIMWSGGKDSCLALNRVQEEGLRVTTAINFYDVVSQRVRFHALRTEIIARQADALGLELVQVGTTADDYERRVRLVFRQLQEDGIRGIVFGNVHLEDVRATCEALCKDSALEHREPLWGTRPLALLEEFVALGFSAIITCVQLNRLGIEWLGRTIDTCFIADIAKMSIDACGENGEYHSCVTSGPLFSRAVCVAAGEVRRADQFAQLDLAVRE